MHNHLRRQIGASDMVELVGIYTEGNWKKEHLPCDTKSNVFTIGHTDAQGDILV